MIPRSKSAIATPFRFTIEQHTMAMIDTNKAGMHHLPTQHYSTLVPHSTTSLMPTGFTPVPLKESSNKTGAVQGTNWASAHIATGPRLRQPLAACGSHGTNFASPHRARSFRPNWVLAPLYSHCFANQYRLPFLSSVIVAIHRYSIPLDFPGCGCIHVGSTQIRMDTLLRFEVQRCASCHIAVF